jgi:hypothetical protein
MFAQSLVDYGATSSLSTTLGQAWYAVTDRVQSLPPIVWYVVIGAAIIVIAVRRAR